MARRPARKTATPSADRWREYSQALATLHASFGGPFVRSIRQAIRIHDQTAIDGYLLWRRSWHPEINRRAWEALRTRYKSVDARSFASFLMAAVRVNESYVKRYGDLLRNAYECLDAHIMDGTWRLPDWPTRQQIEAKFAELGGSENAVATIAREWVRQRSPAAARARAAREEEARIKGGFDTIEELREFYRLQQSSRKQDTERTLWRRFARASIENGEKIDGWQHGDGIIVAENGIAVRLSREETLAVASFLVRRRQSQDARREAPQERRRRGQGDAPTPPPT